MNRGGLLSRLLIVALASLALGALTFVGQGVTPSWLVSLFNSPSGWALFTSIVVLAVGLTPVQGAICGPFAFVGLVLGYTVAAELAGLAYDPTLWGVVGVVTGPFVGAAAAALRDHRPTARLLGAALLAAVALSDTLYGLSVVSESTSSTYWYLIGAVGAILLVAIAARLGSARRVAALLGLTLGLVALGAAAYAAIGSVAISL